MSFYSTANTIIESLASDEVPGKELVQTYVMSLFDMEREATIIYDFLEEEGFLDRGVYMAKTVNKEEDSPWRKTEPNERTHYYIMFPRSVVVGTNVLKRFFNLYKDLAHDNKFHFILKHGDSMLIDGKELVSHLFTVHKWRPMKKQTRSHFGDILDGLNESKEEKWAYLKKVKSRKNDADIALYKFLPFSSLSEKDLKIAEQLQNYTDIYSHGRFKDRKDIKVYINKIKHDIEGFRTITLVIGPKDELQTLLKSDKQYQYGTRMKEEIDLKPKTKKHFGDILSGINEEITTGDIESSARAHERIKRSDNNPDHVAIFFKYDDDSGKQNEYIYKPIKKLSKWEIDVYKKMVKNKIDSGFNDRFNLTVFMGTDDVYGYIRGIDFVNMFKGDKRDLDEFIPYYLWVNRSDKFVEKKPIMKKNAEKHFGDIIDAL